MEAAESSSGSSKNEKMERVQASLVPRLDIVMRKQSSTTSSKVFGKNEAIERNSDKKRQEDNGNEEEMSSSRTLV